MLTQIKQTVCTVAGGLCLFIGLLLLLLPGPGLLFIPIGLALLSLHYPWAKRWLKRSQRLMSKAAKQADNALRRRAKKRS